MRFSRQRQVIVNILRGTTVHPDADWVYNEARKVMPNISLGTVYRNLRLLKDKGDILALEVEDGVTRYDGDISEHSHFCCNKCGKIFDLELDNLPGAELKEQGYSIESCKLMFYGLCPKCNADQPSLAAGS